MKCQYLIHVDLKKGNLLKDYFGPVFYQLQCGVTCRQNHHHSHSQGEILSVVLFNYTFILIKLYLLQKCKNMNPDKLVQANFISRKNTTRS